MPGLCSVGYPTQAGPCTVQALQGFCGFLLCVFTYAMTHVQLVEVDSLLLWIKLRLSGSGRASILIASSIQDFFLKRVCATFVGGGAAEEAVASH